MSRITLTTKKSRPPLNIYGTTERICSVHKTHYKNVFFLKNCTANRIIHKTHKHTHTPETELMQILRIWENERTNVFRDAIRLKMKNHILLLCLWRCTCVAGRTFTARFFVLFASSGSFFFVVLCLGSFLFTFVEAFVRCFCCKAPTSSQKKLHPRHGYTKWSVTVRERAYWGTKQLSFPKRRPIHI